MCAAFVCHSRIRIRIQVRIRTRIQTNTLASIQHLLSALWVFPPFGCSLQLLPFSPFLLSSFSAFRFMILPRRHFVSQFRCLFYSIYIYIYVYTCMCVCGCSVHRTRGEEKSFTGKRQKVLRFRTITSNKTAGCKRGECPRSAACPMLASPSLPPSLPFAQYSINCCQ